jgi:hypothetical protein
MGLDVVFLLFFYYKQFAPMGLGFVFLLFFATNSSPPWGLMLCFYFFTYKQYCVFLFIATNSLLLRSLKNSINQAP